MSKLITLCKSPITVADGDFRRIWQEDFFANFMAIDSVARHLRCAIYHHVLPDFQWPNDVERWAGIGSYYFTSRAAAEKVLADPAYQALCKSAAAGISQISHLLVEEIFIQNRDNSALPVKMFAFFKRLPALSRLQAQQYYQDTHQPLANDLMEHKTPRSIQNHVLLDHHCEHPQYDFDAGPEAWFQSVEQFFSIAPAGDKLKVLETDEAQFIDRKAGLFLLTDRVEVLGEEKPLSC